MSRNIRDDHEVQGHEDLQAYSSASPPDMKMILSSSQGLAFINPTLYTKQLEAYREGSRHFGELDCFPTWVSRARKYFFLFDKLPAELRSDIWKLAAGDPRVITVSSRIEGQSVRLYSKISPHAILHTCRESRGIGLTIFEQLFIQDTFSGYVNYERDIILMHKWELNFFLFTERKQLGKSTLQLCRRLATNVVLLQRKDQDNIELHYTTPFSKLEEIIYVDFWTNHREHLNKHKPIIGFKDDWRSLLSLKGFERKRDIDDRITSLMAKDPSVKRSYQEPVRGWYYRTEEQKAWAKEQKEREAVCDAVMLAAHK
jgi:hypothetical protein